MFSSWWPHTGCVYHTFAMYMIMLDITVMIHCWTSQIQGGGVLGIGWIGWTLPMMTSCKGNIFCVTGHLWRGIHLSQVDSPYKGPVTWALTFIWCKCKQTVEQTIECRWFETHSGHCVITVMHGNVQLDCYKVLAWGGMTVIWHEAWLVLPNVWLISPNIQQAWIRLLWVLSKLCNLGSYDYWLISHFPNGFG